MANLPSKERIKRATIADMKALGVHKPQYNRLVDIYAGLVHQYITLVDEFEKSGYKYDIITDQGSVKKHPILASLETLRKDILAYSDRLCLNPKSFDTVTVEMKGESALAAMLSDLK